jgi:hypothetical protein
MTQAIVVFNFYPLTAIMMVMLTLLNTAGSCISPMTTPSTETSPKSVTCARFLALSTVPAYVFQAVGG